MVAAIRAPNAGGLDTSDRWRDSRRDWELVATSFDEVASTKQPTRSPVMFNKQDQRDKCMGGRGNNHIDPYSSQTTDTPRPPFPSH